MKKIVAALAFCFSFAYSALAQETQTSLGIRVGPKFAESGIGVGQETKSSSLVTDVDLLRHNQYFTWGVGFRKRNAPSPVGVLNYAGGTFLFGFYSNGRKSEKIGFHTMGGVGVGSTLGANGYGSVSPALQAEIRVGADYLVYSTPNPDPRRRPSALTLTLDLGLDVFNQKMKSVNAGPNVKAQHLNSGGLLTSVGLAYYFF